jgi:hypothetical protein
VRIKQVDFQTKRRNLKALQVCIMGDNGKFKIEFLAGEITGEIRKLPIVRQSGGGNVTNSH